MGSRSVAHRWLGRWTEEGVLDKVLQALLGTAELAGLLDWERLAVDGFFSRGKDGGEEIEYGLQGKRDNYPPTGGRERFSCSFDKHCRE